VRERGRRGERERDKVGEDGRGGGYRGRGSRIFDINNALALIDKMVGGWG
jgi:hypothetical protein